MDSVYNELLSENGVKSYFVNNNLQSLPVFCYDETDSTNTRAKVYAQDGGDEAVFIADRQTAGRGRRGRSFNSESGGLYISFLTRPKESARDAVLITVRAAVALCRVIEKNCALTPKIKWVNDVVVNDKKLAGILTEGVFDNNGSFLYAICGVGLNLYDRSFPEEISEIATTIETLTGKRVCREKIAADLTEEFFKEQKTEDVIKEYVARSSVIGEKVTVHTISESYPALAVGINERAELIVEREDGERVALFSGEVSIRKSK